MNSKIQHGIAHEKKCNNVRNLGVPKKYGLRSLLRLLFLISFLTLLYFAASAQKVSINANNESLSSVLQQLRKQSGYAFAYNDQLMAKAKPVSIIVKEKDLKEVLPLVFKGQTLNYRIEGKVITVIENSTQLQPQRKNNRSIGGRVIDSLNHPLTNVTIKIKNTGQVAFSDGTGSFYFEDVPEGSIFTFSLLGYGRREIGGLNDGVVVTLHAIQGMLSEVVVNVNTGYQSIPKERATGSFVVVDSALLNRQVSTNILERLQGTVSGLSYTDVTGDNIANSNPLSRPVGIQIRGVSTLSTDKVSSSPLIVLDNFPYEGDLRNINPNDIESITVLKDAAAASIWGAKSGNGVIVINTKKGKFGEPHIVDFTSNVTIQSKRNLYYDRNFIGSKDYIGIEKKLYENGFFNSDLGDNVGYIPVSPVVAMLYKLDQAGTTPEQRIAIENQIAHFEKQDIRKDLAKYFYQSAIKQQYAASVRGATDKVTYSLSSGWDKNSDNLVRDGLNRMTLNSQSTYRPIANLELSAGILYSQSTINRNNQFPLGYGINMGGSYVGIYPYAKLADENGNPLAIVKDYKTEYVEQALQSGFYDWSYRPLEELRVSQRNTKVSDLIIRANASYRIMDGLKAMLFYQNERQRITDHDFKNLKSYATRDLINRFALRKDDGSFVYQVPNTGGILSLGNYDWNINNARAQLNYEKSFTDHRISALIGTELRETNTLGYNTVTYGYNEQFGSATNALNFSDYLPVNPIGTAKIPSPDGTAIGTLNRYFSQYFNGSYEYRSKYLLSLSARRDGTNLFGVKTNDRITPLWSIGGAWTLSNEDFFKRYKFELLRLRATFGYNGNVYHGTAYVTGTYTTNLRTGLPSIIGLTAPNPELSWERVRNFNLGLDFSLPKNVVSGTIEFYLKDGTNLVQNVELAPSTGFSSFFANTAATSSKGVDINLTSQNLKDGVNWTTTLLLSTYTNKIKSYDVPLTASSIGSTVMGAINKPLSSIFSYRWSGLDPNTGEPQGYLNGNLSKDYTGIINNYSPDSLVYNGPSSPRIFGNLRNDFSYAGFSFSFSVGYKFGYVFRKSSIGLSYAELIQGLANSDYEKRWQNPGDEVNTQVPSVTLGQNQARSNFYRYSEVLVENADHIRLQDIRLAYDLKHHLKYLPFRSFQVYAYASNIGILWRANKSGIDPDVLSYPQTHYLPNPFSVSFGFKTTL
ncbi:SusC/RagA family TonB-linked outer membrane protein [Sphingobacterium siyangense]|uniref:SusC/RagA family TonB-linked outer membrane protein n=1 Tax=Sphingobacterium siyangense TaxID=459529 RepID=UPI002FDD6EC3